MRAPLEFCGAAADRDAERIVRRHVASIVPPDGGRRHRRGAAH
jgi:hypothetical protein